MGDSFSRLQFDEGALDDCEGVMDATHLPR